MKTKRDYHGVCVIKKPEGVIGLACASRREKKMPKKTKRRIGESTCVTYWFDNTTEANGFYEDTAKTIIPA